MDFETFLNDLRSSPIYRGQIVYSRRLEQREAVHADTAQPLSNACSVYLKGAGIDRLYSHQATAIDLVREGRDVLIVTGTASGKSLCYQLPLLEMIETDPKATAILLHPTKALSQDQLRAFTRALDTSGLGPDTSTAGKRTGETVVGVFDGDTPANFRRKLRDEGRVILTNPDMLHAALLPQHTRWAEFLKRLKFVVVDEMHVYAGLFGANAANLFRRFQRVCEHYGSDPQYIFCSATVGNPVEVAKKLSDRDVALVDRDGSPRGPKTYVFWNPPVVRARHRRSRRSANVEAQELMTELVVAGIPTITFSKAKLTAELIHRYVSESLHQSAPHLTSKVTPYRGGYMPEDRREIEKRLFSGELLGVSTTRALELGIDVGGLDASVIVGYPGTLAGFFQQAGRAGRRDRESIVFLVAVDTAINQFVMKHPEYIFGRPIERIVIESDNPYVLSGQLRCAAYELPVSAGEADAFGEYAGLVMEVLTEQRKLNKVGDRWYHASDDVPQHEVSLRDYCDANVAITDVDTGRVIGELSKFDAQPIIHPEAIYMHQGETYIVLELDLERNLCLVKKIETDYYTQPIGGTDVHHIDQPLRQRDFGDAVAYFGEVTAYFSTYEYERIHFYSLDAVSRHPVSLPTYQLETMAFWITLREELVRSIIREGLDVHRGLMGIGYATRMILPLFIQCETLDFSHSSCTAINAPWHTVFVYERYPHGLGFTEEAFEILPDVMRAVYDRVKSCDCRDGCPCCVGKPLRGYTTWNIERGEATIPSKKSTLRILRGIIGDAKNLRSRDAESLGQDEAEKRLILERGIRRRLERMGDPQLFHPIDPNPQVGFPHVEKPSQTDESDTSRRSFKRLGVDKLDKHGTEDFLDAHHHWGDISKPPDYLNNPPDETATDETRRQDVGPVAAGENVTDASRIVKDTQGTANADLEHERHTLDSRTQGKALRNLMRKGKGKRREKVIPTLEQLCSPPDRETPRPEIKLGDSLAARARKMRKKQ